jgi:hypothetical protein
VCPECLTPLVRSPAPDRRFLCVKCHRDTTSDLTNGVSTSISSRPNGTVASSNYQIVVDGDEMDSDQEDQEAGVMQDDPASSAAQANASEGSGLINSA